MALLIFAGLLALHALAQRGGAGPSTSAWWDEQ